MMQFRIEVEQEADGRWIAEVLDIPGVMAYGEDEAPAIAKAKALALRVLPDWVENEQASDKLDYVFAFHDREEIGPRMLARVARRTGSRPEDL